MKHQIVTHNARQPEYLNNVLIFGQTFSSSEKTESEDFQISGALGKQMEAPLSGTHHYLLTRVGKAQTELNSPPLSSKTQSRVLNTLLTAQKSVFH